MNKLIFALGLVAVLSTNIAVASILTSTSTSNAVELLDKDKDKKKKKSKKECSTDKKGCCDHNKTKTEETK